MLAAILVGVLLYLIAVFAVIGYMHLNYSDTIFSYFDFIMVLFCWWVALAVFTFQGIWRYFKLDERFKFLFYSDMTKVLNRIYGKGD